MQSQVRKVLRIAPSADRALVAAVDELIGGLDRLLLEEGLDLQALGA